ncbi:MAG: Hpt domain-containing protein [Methyloligellaceae bacterium]
MELKLDNAHVASAEAGGQFFGPAPGRPVDLVHLARYTLGNTSHEREVLALFHTQSDICLKRLETADHELAWQDAAHTIRDSARDIGAWRVAKSAEDAEALCGNALAAFRNAALKALQRDVGEANGYIQLLLADA